MKKKLNSMTIEITYKVAETSDSINDAIGREIHEIETLDNASKIKRDQLKALIKENRDSIDVDAVSATLKANGYSKQKVHALLSSFGIVRRHQKKSAVSKAMQDKAMSELANLRKRYTDKAQLTALLRRMYDLARSSK